MHAPAFGSQANSPSDVGQHESDPAEHMYWPSFNSQTVTVAGRSIFGDSSLPLMSISTSETFCEESTVSCLMATPSMTDPSAETKRAGEVHAERLATNAISTMVFRFMADLPQQLLP